MVAQQLGVALKQSVIVEARPGANGAISAMYVARAPADGYTLLMTTNSPHSAAPFLMKNLAYDPIKDFAPISRLGSFTLMLVINPSIPAKTVKELIEYARANPGKLTFASGNSAGVVAGETLKHWAKLDMLHVPYKSTPHGAHRPARRPRVDDVRRPHHRHAARAGRRRCGRWRSTRIKRSALFPDLPTMDEAGVTGFDMDAWAGFVVPANTPPEVIALLNKEMRPIIDDPEDEGHARAGPASRRSQARRRSWTTSSRSSSANGRRWSRTPASSRNEAANRSVRAGFFAIML